MRKIFVLAVFLTFGFSTNALAQSNVTCSALDNYEKIASSRTVRFIKEEIDSAARWLSEQDFSAEEDLGRSISGYWNERFAGAINRAGEFIPDQARSALEEIWEYNLPEIRRERWGRTLINECTIFNISGDESFVLKQVFRINSAERDICDCFRARSVGQLPTGIFR